MESRNHPLRLPLPTPRRPMHRRTASSSSEASHASNASHHSNRSEDQFVLSPAQTPANENPPPRVMVSRHAMDASAARNTLLLGKEINTRPRDPETIRKSPSFFRLGPSSKSKPIAIDLPGTQRAEPVSASSSIPPEPLSARGDVPGGYFPLHEDPDSRTRVPHPFHLETDMARQSSLQRAAESSKSGSDPRPLSPAHASMSNSASVSSSVNTPISSYNPSGLHDDVVLPMGKYYPSNWEKRHGKVPENRPSTQPAPAPVTMRSEPQVPKYHGDRPGSDIKRRLQQYQRDMVAQAAMAANALIASSGSASPATGASPLGGAATLSKAQLAATFFKTHKPLSPRLRPVGSPGPVTPMSLEADCYLALGSPVSGGLEAEFPPGMEIGGSGTTRAGKGKQRQKDPRASPAELVAASI